MNVNSGECLATPQNVTCDISGTLHHTTVAALSVQFQAALDCDFGDNNGNANVTAQEFPDIVRQAESCTCKAMVTRPTNGDDTAFPCDCTVCPQGFGRAPFSIDCGNNNNNAKNALLLGTCAFLDCSLSCNGTCSVTECLADTNPACPICQAAPGRWQAEQNFPTVSPSVTSAASRMSNLLLPVTTIFLMISMTTTTTRLVL